MAVDYNKITNNKNKLNFLLAKFRREYTLRIRQSFRLLEIRL